MSIKQRPNTFRSSFDYKEIPEDAELEDVINSYNTLIMYLNLLTKTLSLQSNFDGYVVEVSIPATSSVAIPHFLGVTPKYRIILRQTGNGVLTDVVSSSAWNDKVITLYNNGAVTVTATILIARE